MKRTFAIALFAATLAASALGADDLYLVTLRAEAAADRLATVAELFAVSYGGIVADVDAVNGTMLMRLPASRVATAGRDPRVQSIRAAGAPRVATDAVEVVPWGAGVTYAYDGAGNVTKIQNDEFTYDVASRLVQSKINGGTRNYEYDAFGNRTKCMQGATDCQGHTIVPSNNRISGIGYDAAGNVTTLNGHQFTYDALNMQIRDTDTTNGVTRDYVYTADDERIAVYTVNQWWRWTIRDALGKVLREYMSEGQQGTQNWQWVKDYVWRDGILLATRHVPPGGSTGATYHYHVDHLGTPRRITDSGDRIVGFHDYFAFGPETTTGKVEPSLSLFKYTGHERDITDSSTAPPLDYMMARYYSTTIARFLSQDPVIDTKRAAKAPQSWNRYAYVVNNPIRFTDPSGEYTCSGWTSECEAFERALMVLRAASAEAARGGVPGATRLADVVKMYGTRGQVNGVNVSFGALKRGAAMATKYDAKNNLVEVKVDRASFVSLIDNYFALAVQQAHEGDHGLTFRADPSRANSRSRRLFMAAEISAYRTQASVNAALRIDDEGYQLWTKKKGFDAFQMGVFATESVAIGCEDVPCTP